MLLSLATAGGNRVRLTNGDHAIRACPGARNEKNASRLNCKLSWKSFVILIQISRNHQLGGWATNSWCDGNVTLYSNREGRLKVGKAPKPAGGCFEIEMVCLVKSLTTMYSNRMGRSKVIGGA